MTSLEAPNRLVVEVRGMGYAMTEAIELEDKGPGTRARFVERVWPTSLAGRLLVAISRGVMRRDLAKRRELLKSVLEQSPQK